MTLNDFKSIEGDRQMGVRSLPVMLGRGARGTAGLLVMAVPQLAVVACCWPGASPLHAACVALLLVAQVALMPRFLAAAARARAVVQRHRHQPVRARHAGLRLRAAGDAMRA